MSQQNILLSCSFTTTKKQVFRMVSWKLGTYQAKCQWKNSEVKATPNDPAWILILTHTTVRSHDYSSSCPTQQTEVNTTGVILCLSWWKTADETASQRGRCSRQMSLSNNTIIQYLSPIHCVEVRDLPRAPFYPVKLLKFIFISTVLFLL